MPVNTVDRPPPSGLEAAVPRRVGWKVWLVLGGIFALAIGLRMWHLTAESLWFDETWHMALAEGRGFAKDQVRLGGITTAAPKMTSPDPSSSVGRIWTYLDGIAHPPMFLIALRWWRAIFGESDFAARALPAIQSAIAVLLIFDAARHSLGLRAAMWAALIMAVAPSQIYIAQEVRGYGQLLLAAMLACAALGRIVTFGANWRRLLALAAGVWLMVMTHYFAAGAALAIGLAAVVSLRGRNRWLTLTTLAGAGVLFVVTWGPAMLRQHAAFADARDTWLIDTSDSPAASTLLEFARLPVRMLFEPMPRVAGLARVGAVLFVIAPILAIRRPELRLWCFWLAGAAGLIVVMDLVRQTTHLQYLRYTILAGPAVYVLLASMTTGRMRHLLPAGIVLACLGAIPEAYNNPKPDWRPVAAFLDQRIGPRDLIAFWKLPASEKSVPEYVWSTTYLSFSHYSKSFPRDVLVIDGTVSPQTLKDLQKYRRVWLVTPTGEPLEALPGWRVVDAGFFPYSASVFAMEPAQTTTPPGAH